MSISMMHQPLLVSSLLVHAERHHGDQQIVSRRVEGDLHRYTYRDMASRARRLAKALQALGLPAGARVGTLAWNGYRHLELYYATSGSGVVLNTLNPRLHPDQLEWIVGDAQDQVLFFDKSFLPLAQALAQRATCIQRFVILTDRAQMPDDAGIPGLQCYEDLLAEQADDQFVWPVLDELSGSSLCYTSGTTGNPKGVLYTQRSTVLHSMASALPDAFDLSASDAVLPVVPMFHVNAWGLPYAACMVGARLVLPGPQLDGKSLYELFESEGVTLSAGVPTVWQGLLTHVQRNDLRFSTMRRTVVGGAACPPAMAREFELQHGVTVIHAWGMTELSPLGAVNVPKPGHQTLSAEAQLALKAKQGRSVFGIDMMVLSPDGKELAWDGQQAGELMVRGHWVAASYLNHAESPLWTDGQGAQWFPTGDVATIDADGFMHITDRSKDVIKSGGEWIGSIDLENIAMGFPGVAMAACIAARHPKWDERPLLIAVRKPGADVAREALLAHYEGKVAKWWTPDDVVFVDAIPLGATGKMLKQALRAQYGDHLLAAQG
jgi:acyl-CoA synthetase (AMP-forming)/AMP-acid ligase II